MIRFLSRNRKDYEQRVAQRELLVPRVCPDCDGRMHRHGWYLRGVDELGGKTYWLWIQRLRCTDCGKTHALLPHFLAAQQRMSTPAREAVARAWVAGRVWGACRRWPAAVYAP